MSNRAGSTVRIILVGLAMLAVTELALSEDSDALDPNTSDMVHYLLGALVKDPTVTPERIVGKLVELGPRAVPCLVSSYAEYSDRAQVAAVIAALKRLDPTGVDTYLLAQTAGNGDESSRADAYVKLAEFGTADAIPALIGQLPENHYSQKRSAELCLTRLLRKYDSAEAYLGVGQAMKGLDDDTGSRVACCMGDTASAHAMRLLISLFGRSGPLDHALVSAIAQMPGVLPAQEVVPHLRGLLESEEHGVARETITALGMFEDAESVRALVEILADAPEGLRGNAHWALKHISGLDFPDDADRWRLWHQGELSWWESTGKGLLEMLSAGDKDAIIGALRALARGRLFRDLIRPGVEILLEDPDADIRAAAEDLMRQLGFSKSAEAGNVNAAMASRGFKSIPRDQIPGGPAPETETARPFRSTSFVPIAGLAVLLVLLARLVGPAALERVKRIWGGDDKRDGPMTVKLKPKSYARKSCPEADRSPEREGTGARKS